MELSSAHITREHHDSHPLSSEKMLIFAIVGVWVASLMGLLLAFESYRTELTPVRMDLIRHTALAYAVGSILTLGVCRLVAGRLWSLPLCITLSALTSLMYIGIAINLAGWFPPEAADALHPDLYPWTDSWISYRFTEMVVSGEAIPYGNSVGYPMFESVFLSTFGIGIVAPLVFNALCMSVSAAICGKICSRMVPLGREVSNMWMGALLMALIPSIPYYGTLFMKEAPLTLAFSLYAILLCDIYQGHVRLSSLIWAAPASVIVMMLKAPIGVLFAIGALCCMVHAYVAYPARRKNAMTGTIASLLMAAAVIAAGQKLRATSPVMLLDTKVSDISSKNMLGDSAVGNYSDLLPDYYQSDIVHKVSYLPLTATAQYFPPFPWNFTRDKHIGHFVPYVHLSPLWYLVGGLWLGYFVLCMPWRRRSGGLRLWAVYWAICWVGIAVMSAGSVSRYWLPFVCLFIPLALQCLRCFQTKILSSRTLYIYSGSYLVLLGTGLWLAYNYLNHS